jgi:hypothetical protein
VDRLKASARLVTAIEPAVALYEEPPTTEMTVTTPWADIVVGAEDWAQAFEAPGAGTAHNEARDLILEELVTTLTDKRDDDVPGDLLRRSLRRTGSCARPWTGRGRSSTRPTSSGTCGRSRPT